MVKHRKWQLSCIVSVILLTLYNIAPTIFYYAQPLSSPVHEEQAFSVASSITQRVNDLEKESTQWIDSFCDLIGTNPQKISLDPKNPQWISIHFAKNSDAKKFKERFPQAGSAIPFAPAALYLNPIEERPNVVTVGRLIPYHLGNEDNLFSFTKKGDSLDEKLFLDQAARLIAALSANAPSKETLKALLNQSGKYSFTDPNSPFEALSIHPSKESVFLSCKTEKKESGQKALAGAIASLHLPHEKIVSLQEGFQIPFHTLENRSGSLVVDLSKLAHLEIKALFTSLKDKWKPQHPDLQMLSFVEEEGYNLLSPAEKGMCLIALSPSSSEKGSLQLSLKGIERVGQTYADFPQSPIAEQFREDLHTLYTLLAHHGFSIEKKAQEIPFAGDALFEKSNFALPFLMAGREAFFVTPDQNYALLDFSTREHRILAENKIDTKIHEELIEWSDAYQAAQVSLHPVHRYDIPKPTRSVLLSNLLLSLKKMVRGDEKKILRWGLDLSGGKTVEIELRDDHHRVVESDAEIKQGMQELYQRVGKMGLSEVSIRQVGKHIVLDFPGSQSLSAADLIQASSMSFHILYEKFSPNHPIFGETVHRFLQGIWDEALFLHKTDAESIQEIGRKHLSSKEGLALQEQGLRLFDPNSAQKQEGINTTDARIVIQKGSSPLDWHGASHPLLIAFHESALEGSQLENIHAAYDPSRGNYLSFSVASSYQTRDGIRINPQQIFYDWTSRYSKENIGGTPQELDSQGRGWRMAIVLNDTVINAPTLDSALKESAMISGRFSQTEVQRLCADLKAGSMTFTPHILSEKNVSPELGQTDRMQGILATVAALVLVIVSMTIYYRFAGVVASIAVLFNLLILWGVLQNLGAALSLAGIAGIILTVGMSIDANVLVFERIKEELSQGKKLGSAIAFGYNKAFSAILDSNVTTVIAALILLNFDAGPIKSFAMNLIIGITASMFTALFMTRFYFTHWAQNPKNQALKMAHWIRETSFSFLKQTNIAFGVAFTIIAVGLGALFSNSSSILGLDFTGGFSLQAEVKEAHGEGTSYAQKVSDAFVAQGAAKQDFQIQEMSETNQLRILLAQNMEQEGKPFFGLPMETSPSDASYFYEKNPRIVWVVDALEKAGVSLTEESLSKLHSNWTAVSGQMSDTMRNQALLGFALSFIAIFIYLAFRFEYKFAAAALLCLIHDLLITLAVMGLLHALHVPIQIDLITIAALMTAVGYSLNDTIIIFDRIREEIGSQGKRSYFEIVDSALNATLSRTVITSGTTLLVLLALLVLGGNSIFGFACVMTIGVIFGTLSSWFIAAPLMLFFHAKEEGSKNPFRQLSQHVK